MSNFLNNLGQVASTFVPTMIALDQQKIQNQRMAQADKRADAHLDIERQTADQLGGMRKVAMNRAQQQADDETAVRSHVTTWGGNRQKLMAGDYSALEKEIRDYNGQLGAYNNGKTIKMRTTEDGKATILDHYDENGDVLESSKPLTRRDAVGLYDLAMMEKLKYMSPARYDAVVKAAADQAEKQKDRESLERRAETGADARMYGADVRAGATTDAAGIRADASRDTAKIRAARPAAGVRGPTLAQDRGNLEIDAAREAVKGMSPEEIKDRTQQYGKTGRINDAYDSGLARQAALAARRKVGDDLYFDQRQSRQPAATETFAGKPLDQLTDAQLQQFSRAAGTEGRIKLDTEFARRSLAGTPGMQGHKIGAFVEGKGFQVLDPQGRPVSYLRRKAQ